MKDIRFKLISGIAIAILLAKLFGAVFNFSPESIKLINSIMFIYIGAVILLFAYAITNKLYKIILVLGGIYIIVYSFLPKETLYSIPAIIAIIGAMLIGKYSKETTNTANED
jgi:hypothetical protein